MNYWKCEKCGRDVPMSTSSCMCGNKRTQEKQDTSSFKCITSDCNNPGTIKTGGGWICGECNRGIKNASVAGPKVVNTYLDKIRKKLR